MGSTITPQQIEERLAAFEQGRHRRLLARAAELQLVAERDTRAAGYAVRSPLHRGYVELVTAEGCTCQEYDVRGHCPHAAYIRECHGRFPHRPRSPKHGRGTWRSGRSRQAIRDYGHPHRCIVWETGPDGFCEYVTPDTCPGRQFAAIGTCAHHELALETLGIAQRDRRVA